MAYNGCCNSCYKNPCACNVVPLPYYEDPCFQQNQCQGVQYIVQYTPVIKISNNWAVPEADTVVTLRVPGVTEMLIGSYLWNPDYGFYVIVSFDKDAQSVKLVKTLHNDTEVGTTIPSCTKFITSASAELVVPLPIEDGGTGLTAVGNANQLLGTNSAGNDLEYKAVEATAAGALTTAEDITITSGDLNLLAGNIVWSSRPFIIKPDTVDLTNNKDILIYASDSDNSHGARLHLIGNEFGFGEDGWASLVTGDAAGAHLGLASLGGATGKITYATNGATRWYMIGTSLIYTNIGTTIAADTTVGSNTKGIDIGGGGVVADTDGSFIRLFGNERPGATGQVYLSAGNVAAAAINLLAPNTTGYISITVAGVEVLRIPAGGAFVVLRTNTTAGTTGAQTIDKPAGSVNFAAGATTLVVTNSLVSATSNIFAEVQTNDTTAIIKNVIPGAGSFTIRLNAAATAETRVAFWVTN